MSQKFMEHQLEVYNQLIDNFQNKKDKQMDTEKQQPENEQPTNTNDEMNPVSESGDPDEQVDMDELAKRDADEEE